MIPLLALSISLHSASLEPTMRMKNVAYNAILVDNFSKINIKIKLD